MCVSVYNKDTQEHTDSPVEFAHMLGVPTSTLPVDNVYGQLIPEACLCQVDIKKACEINGFNYEEDNHDNWDIRISKKTPEEIVKSITSHR
jgi:hypothetical protein